MEIRIADMITPPANPISAMTRDSRAACQGANGVAHQSAAPTRVAQPTPPRNPSQVLFGLTRGRILCLPTNSPTMYWSTSQTWSMNASPPSVRTTTASSGEMSVLMNAHPLIGPALAELFMQVMFGPGALTRPERTTGELL